MARVSWRRLEEEIARRGGARFWWRDDDAAQRTPALERLLALSERYAIPLALAVIPQTAVPALFKLLKSNTSVLQHGCDHRNRAAPGEKKTEFPASEGDRAALERLVEAKARLRELGGERVLPVLVPPWNRIRPSLVSSLPGVGFRGLSRYGEGQAPVVPGLKQVNTHVDIVAWRAGRRFIGDERALSSVLKLLNEENPVGWLTHHAVHDAAAWRFLERLLRLEGVRWASAPELFSYTAPAHG